MNADKTISDVHAPVRILIHTDGGLAALLSALRDRLWRVLVNDLTLKEDFVDLPVYFSVFIWRRAVFSRIATISKVNSTTNTTMIAPRPDTN